MKDPSISVIIPMYNTEKYIAKCLESILIQTFQDFEVIVVDDCSEDNSFAIAESYLEKFNGRLRIDRTQKNSGGGGYVPRNIGLKLARGEYILFVDSDDFIVETALEILHAAATQSAADVVYTPRYYFYDKAEKMQLVSDLESIRKSTEDTMTLTVDDTQDNCRRLFIENGILHMPWTKFVKRNFLIENKIEFPKIISGGDFIWTIQVVYHSKRFLRLPIALYFYNNNSDSVTRKEKPSNKKLIDTIKAFLMGASILKCLADEIPVLKSNKNYLHYSMRVFFGNCLARNFEARKQFSMIEFYEILCDEFKDDYMIPFLLSIIDSDQKALINLQRRVAELEGKE